MTDRDISHLAEQDQAYIRELREESKTRRLKVSELEGKLGERDTAVNQALTRITDLESQIEAGRTIQQNYDTLRDAHAEVLSKADQASLDLLRLNAALDAELPKDFADRLKGSTKEELEADAKTLKEKVGTGTKPGNSRVSFDRTVSDSSGSETGPRFPSIAQHVAQQLGGE